MVIPEKVESPRDMARHMMRRTFQKLPQELVSVDLLELPALRGDFSACSMADYGSKVNLHSKTIKKKYLEYNRHYYWKPKSDKEIRKFYGKYEPLPPILKSSTTMSRIESNSTK